MEIYCIGGSPCSGKSTIAQMMADQFGFAYFRVDDHLERYLEMGAKAGFEACSCATVLAGDDLWMRDSQLQCVEELMIYEEIFPFILDDLRGMRSASPIITEGAAFLPNLVRQIPLPSNRYFALTPTEDFQVSHYSKREWVPYVLEGCSDPAAAFQRWMKRDALFALEVQKRCAEAGYLSLINDGSRSVSEIYEMTLAHFGLI